MHLHQPRDEAAHLARALLAALVDGGSDEEHGEPRASAIGAPDPVALLLRRLDAVLAAPEARQGFSAEGGERALLSALADAQHSAAAAAALLKLLLPAEASSSGEAHGADCNSRGSGGLRGWPSYVPHRLAALALDGANDGAVAEAALRLLLAGLEQLGPASRGSGSNQTLSLPDAWRKPVQQVLAAAVAAAGGPVDERAGDASSSGGGSSGSAWLSGLTPTGIAHLAGIVR